ncbi:tetratricopeptide repeat protein [Selenomonas sp. AB3002]|uniref:tetratricopeptide repeat protein n=1 Tax=Selenomonas sp. AB3002 TaxID=1392502 RepID=UPI000497B29D
MKYKIFIICVLGMLVYINEANASVAKFSSVGEYVMSNVDTMEISEAHALDYAKQAAAEQAGVYVENYTHAEKMQVVEDDIKVITSQQIKVINKDVKKIMLSSGEIKIRVEIVASVDTSDIDDYMKIREEVRNRIKEQYYTLERDKKKLEIELSELRNKINNGTIDDLEAEREKMRQDREYKALLMLEEGGRNWKNADYEGMIVNNNQALALNPKYAFAYNNRAVAYEAYGDFAKANEGYVFATIIDSAYTEPHYNLGNIYYKLEEYDKAINEYQKAIAIDQNYAKAYGNLGIAYIEIGQYDKAIQYLEKAMELDGRDKDHRYNLIIAKAKRDGKFTAERLW